MEHVDNDMDDLFRKAGDLYPLKTSESDWDGVLGKLRIETLGDQASIPVIAAKGKNKKRRWGFLLLLIPIGLGSVIYFSSGKKNQITIPPAANTVSQGPQPDKTNKKAEGIGQGQTDRKLTTGNKLSDETSVENASLPFDKWHPKNNVQAKSSLPTSGNAHSFTHSHTGNVNGVSENAATENSTTTEMELNSVPAVPLLYDPSAKAVASPISSQKETAGVTAVLKKTDSVSKDTLSNISLGKIIDQSVKPVNGFYLGLLAGPDWSAVKFQDVKQTGFSFGVLVGYRFSKRIAIESGFMMDKKYYYSSGEYFNQAKTDLPDTEHVIDLNGNCFMFEIPLNFRYDFAIGKNHSYFANAGLSSYLMKSENYNLNAVQNTGGNPWIYSPKTYKNSTNNLFSILQLSAGYERDIGSKNKIRVEPYIKIPLQGVGISSMPISSAGIYFGIIHSFK